MAKFLVSDKQILEQLAAEKPDSKVDILCEAIGAVATFILLEKMACKTVNFPSVSTLKRMNKSAFIISQLKDLKDWERAERVRQIAKLLNMPKKSVIKTFETKKYVD